MKIRRISFIEAGAAGFQMLRKYHIARTGTVLLSTMLRDQGYEVKAFIEDISKPDWDFVESSDLVCISTLTSTALRAYRIGERVRAKGIPVILGGVHPTFLPEEALDYSDFVLRGEADFTLPQLIRHMETGAPAAEDIRGLSFRRNCGFVHNQLPDFIREEELNALPFPDFSLVHNWKPSIIYPVATSRGCPFECRFCSVITMFGRKYRFKSVENTLRELRYINTVSKATKFFVDDNFTANKQRSKELMRGMIAEGLTSTWAAQTRVDVANDTELLRLMADSGCHTIYVGFESINPDTLKAYNKKQGVEDIIRCVRTVKDHGLHIHGMFVLGADSDDVDMIKRTADFAINVGIDTTQIMSLTPLPGTPLFAEMEQAGRLLHKDWSKYNLQHVVFRPAQMTPKTLQMETLKGMGRFYSWKYILKHLAKFDLHYVAVGFFGRKIVSKTLKEVTPYIDTVA
ncbi:MAG: radical SAM protein [Candidatus Sulfobium sp.]|jgi:radical SAM superfamily enzyme YgiQ (UPF0313 family)